MRALGLELGYYPIDDWKKALTVDMVLETHADLFQLYAAALVDPQKTDEQKAQVFQDSTGETGLATKLMKLIDTSLSKNGGGKFLTGDDLTIADFALISLFFNIFLNESGPFSPIFTAWLKPTFPRVEAYAQALGEAQSKHLKSRGKAIF